MKIAIMGSGGVGCYFGARLAASGQDVVFIARDRQLDALRGRGLSLKSPHGDLTLPKVRATDDPASVGPVDVVLDCVKLYDLAASASFMRPLIGPATMVVPVQNGVTAPDELAAILGPERLVGGLVYISCFVVEPGQAVHTSQVHGLVLGELDGRPSPRVAAFQKAGAAAGFDCRAADNIRSEMWKKFVLLAGFSPITCLSRQPIGPLLDDPDLRALFVQSMLEVVTVGSAEGVVLPDDIVDRTLALCRNFDPTSTSSMHEDLEAGKPLELDWISGTVARLGAKHGVPVPFHEVAYTTLKPLARGRRRSA